MYFCAYSEFAKDYRNSWMKMNSYSILIFVLDFFDIFM